LLYFGVKEEKNRLMAVAVKTTPEALRLEPGVRLPEPVAYDEYHRYHIETKPAPDIIRWPNRFRVKVKKHGLAWLLVKEILHHRTKTKVITSRPCMYGVFGRPVGGFAPRGHLCVGCLRCTTEYPGVAQIYRNPEHNHLGDSYFTPAHVEAVHYESQTGKIPVKGAGYRGKFGGEGWDGMWTDMSEIVRPTRDGIHGREFISTVVDIGGKPSFLTFDERGLPISPTPGVFSIPLPIFFDAPPASVTSKTLLLILSEAARSTETLAIMPLSAMMSFQLGGEHIVPLVAPEDYGALDQLDFEPRMIEMAVWDEKLYEQIQSRFPNSVPGLRLNFASGLSEELLRYADSGVRVFHLVADYHGRGLDGGFVLDLIREAHRTFVDAACRDEVTLLGSGGIIAAEHVPKAILCGLDAVALDTPLLVALQTRLVGQCVDREMSRFQLPRKITVPWGVQRLQNLLASWRDQMLEVLGAMGLREVRRLRGEVGRVMFQKDLEGEAFEGITGYGDNG
jgi:hypothetical protein